MSLAGLLLNEYKSWLNARVNNLTIDGSITGGSGNSGSFLATFSGPWGIASLIGPIHYQKIGNFVSLFFPDIIDANAGSPNVITCPAGTIPANLRPLAGDVHYAARVVNVSVIQEGPGVLSIGSTGSIAIGRNMGAGTTFDGGSGNKGMYSTGVTYSIAN